MVLRRKRNLDSKIKGHRKKTHRGLTLCSRVRVGVDAQAARAVEALAARVAHMPELVRASFALRVNALMKQVVKILSRRAKGVVHPSGTLLVLMLVSIFALVFVFVSRC